MNTRKIVIGMDAGFAGTDAWEFYEVPVTLTEVELDRLAWDCAKQHAEMYGVYPLSEYEGDEDPDESIDGDQYSDNIEGWWEDYDAEKHDGHTTTGTPHWEQY